MELLKKTVQKSIIEQMKSNYSEAYMTNIVILADMIIQFYLLLEKEESDVLEQALDNLKNDIVSYADSLKLSNEDLTKIINENESHISLYKGGRNNEK